MLRSQKDSAESATAASSASATSSDDYSSSEGIIQDKSEQDEHQDSESNLGLLTHRNRLPLTADHHPDFQPPARITARLQDHVTRSIVTTVVKTFIPFAAQGHFAVNALQNHQRNSSLTSSVSESSKKLLDLTRYLAQGAIRGQ